MVQALDSTPEDAYAALQGGALLIDVREGWEHEQASVPGAVLIPLGEIADRIDEIPEDRDVFVMCRMGGRSSRATAFLNEHGRTRARNVAGGLDAWRAAGLPVTE